MSNSNDHPELAKAEKVVSAAEAAVSDAQAVVARLEEKREAAIKHGTALADERANVALAAHTGDEKAARRLKEIHQAIAMHGSEAASLDAALRAAGANGGVGCGCVISASLERSMVAPTKAAP